jgi:hypothetical protein
MNLQVGFPLVVAPLFRLAVDWSAQLLLSPGVEEEQGRFFPRLDWRTPTNDELALLVSDSSSDQSPDLEQALCLYQLPQHLHTLWWNLIEQSSEPGAPSPGGFDFFVQQVAGLLAFKGLAVPPQAVFDLVAGKPGQRSVPWDVRGTPPVGLAFNRPRAAWPLSEGSTSSLWGAVNLGDEPLSLLLCNLSVQQIEGLGQRRPHQSAPHSLAELARQFLTACPDYPLVRLILAPGQGFRLPTQGSVLMDTCTLDLQGPGLFLAIHQDVSC